VKIETIKTNQTKPDAKRSGSVLSTGSFNLVKTLFLDWRLRMQFFNTKIALNGQL